MENWVRVLMYLASLSNDLIRFFAFLRSIHLSVELPTYWNVDQFNATNSDTLSPHIIQIWYVLSFPHFQAFSVSYCLPGEPCASFSKSEVLLGSKPESKHSGNLLETVFRPLVP